MKIDGFDSVESGLQPVMLIDAAGRYVGDELLHTLAAALRWKCEDLLFHDTRLVSRDLCMALLVSLDVARKCIPDD